MSTECYSFSHAQSNIFLLLSSFSFSVYAITLCITVFVCAWGRGGGGGLCVCFYVMCICHAVLKIAKTILRVTDQNSCNPQYVREHFSLSDILVILSIQIYILSFVLARNPFNLFDN